MKLTPTQSRHTYQFGDTSGYRYEVIASLDDEFGWSASISISSFGLDSVESAVLQLGHAAQHFIRQLQDASAE